ncbi:MAG TPA: hypothetical protein VKA92_01545 [Segetibacter sp.]|nr:hypothetical protein [Segetibacter sp.]
MGKKAEEYFVMDAISILNKSLITSIGSNAAGRCSYPEDYRYSSTSF